MQEDFQPFYAIAKKHRSYRWTIQKGVGRMLRAASVFEDVVKMICTTNCSWSLTKSMVGNLVELLGERWNGSAAFPTPEALAGTTERFARKEIRAGYRSPFLIEFAERVASGNLEVESWRTLPMASEELFKHLCGIKGVGEYAAGNLMRLLGHYDAMAFDSWVRAEFYKKHKSGRRVSDATITKHYAEFGKWRGLFFWVDMTKDWFKKKLPF
jgi:N-glycosylase/DNA lyase